MEERGDKISYAIYFISEYILVYRSETVHVVVVVVFFIADLRIIFPYDNRIALFSLVTRCYPLRSLIDDKDEISA